LPRHRERRDHLLLEGLIRSVGGKPHTHSA
jgi:hypothetical protein